MEGSRREGQYFWINKLNLVEMQQIFSNFICFVLALSIDATTCSDVNKCMNFYSSRRHIFF